MLRSAVVLRRWLWVLQMGVLQESAMMIPETRKNLEARLAELKALVVRTLPQGLLLRTLVCSAAVQRAAVR
jgi:hypothetical protein